MKTKTMTKEELATRLDGRSYRDEIPREEFNLAHDSGLVVVVGYSDDVVVFHGAIHDEIGAWDGAKIELTQAGIFQSECHHGADCPYFKQLCHKQEVNILKVFWCGKFKDQKALDWEKKGKPTWMFRLENVPVSEFSIYDPPADDEHYCRGIVFELKNLKPFLLDK